MTNPRIGYVPYDKSLRRPGDRRRFIAYAKARGLEVEIADIDQRYDLVVLTEVADISAWARYPHGKIVYDLIDSYLAVPRSNLKQWLRGPVWYAIGRHRYLTFDYWRAIQDMCRRADAVVCSTEEQRSDIQPYCSNTHVLLDVHDSVTRSVKQDYRRGETFNLVWEGLPSNLPQLARIGGVLRQLRNEFAPKLHVITDPYRPRFVGRFGRIDSRELVANIFGEVEFHPWEEASLAHLIESCDVGVIPIDLSDRFVTGKPENKLLLMWRMGMPVVASATPAYARAMTAAGQEAFSCRSDADWLAALRRLANDAELRRESGQRGRAFAEDVHGRERTLARWDAVMSSIGINPGASS